MTGFLRLLCRAGVWLLAALGALFVAAAATPVCYWWATALSEKWNEPPGDVLIVLGGSTLDNGSVGGSSYWRGIYAALLYGQARYSRIVVSGGPEGDSSAALAVSRLMVCQGVPAGVIHLEDRSDTTRENALHTARLLRNVPGKKLLLTSDYHMYRAIRCFRKAGLEADSLPVPDVRKRVNIWRARWPAFLDLAEETVKILYYYARGWI
ncbi:MAG: YdcF family protein [Bryobacterales bacterium]|nr:YdcF family protein [Bryobacterales bacterium]